MNRTATARTAGADPHPVALRSGAALRFPGCPSGEWRNRQTRWLQVPVRATSWGFKSPLAHHERAGQRGCAGAPDADLATAPPGRSSSSHGGPVADRRAPVATRRPSSSGGGRTARPGRRPRPGPSRRLGARSAQDGLLEPGNVLPAKPRLQPGRLERTEELAPHTSVANRIIGRQHIVRPPSDDAVDRRRLAGTVSHRSQMARPSPFSVVRPRRLPRSHPDSSADPTSTRRRSPRLPALKRLQGPPPPSLAPEPATPTPRRPHPESHKGSAGIAVIQPEGARVRHFWAPPCLLTPDLLAARYGAGWPRTTPDIGRAKTLATLRPVAGTGPNL